MMNGSLSGQGAILHSDSCGARHALSWKSGILSSQVTRDVITKPVPPYATGNSPYTGYRPRSGRIMPTGTYKEVGPTNPHRTLYRPSPTRPTETSVTRMAPYASRLRETIFYQPSGSAASSNGGSVLDYNSLSDKYLYDYWDKKFKPPRPPSGRRTNDDGHSKTPLKKNEAVYKIAITTADKKNAGTDAKVYITLHGIKGKLPKKQLTRPAIKGSKKKKARFKFNRGTTHVFRFVGKDIGDLTHIKIEHDGLTKDQGWFLDQVEVMKKPKTGKEKCWLFTCHDWLSLHESDCQISKILYSLQSSKTEYEIVTVTGDTKGAGTDANVYLTIYGKSGKTPKLHLKSRDKLAFERGQSDVFRIKTNSVGPMEKVRIQHDNTGLGPGWYLERVVVTDTSRGKWKYFFPCGKWLAKDEDDGLICRDLLGSRSDIVRKMNKYRVTVITADKKGAGTDANVHIQLFGDLGDSAEKKLTSRKNNFERAAKDEFMVECPNLGTLKRCRIGHDNSGMGPGWFLDKVIVDDLEKARVYDFPCDRWLARDEDDGQISRDLICGVGPGDAPPGVPYTITVTTGDVTNAGTSAGVFLIMNGKNNNSGKIWLQGGKFERGRTDIFNIDVAEVIYPLESIEIGHDNKGAGPGWYLEKASVKCPIAKYEAIFTCKKWFATDEGDGALERTLYPTEVKKIKQLVPWFVRVFTSDMRGAGTDANVWFVLYGKNKEAKSLKSDEIKLDNKGDNFEQGEEDKFKVEVEDIGSPYKLRIGHDNSGSFAGWHLDRVEMENMVTKEKYIFPCQRWLATDEEDGTTIREIPAMGVNVSKPQPLVQYAVSVHTGSKSGAGTDANVFLNVFGEQGDTGERPLTSSKNNKNKFEKGNVDEFMIDAVTLKKLRKIRIGHDGEGAGAGWFLDKVVVRPLDDPSQEQVFECGRWLDTKEDDGLIVREITAGGSQMLSTTSYHLAVKTGNVMGAGTDASVYIKLFGKTGDTGTLQLKSADNTKNKFERGRTDLFKLEATDIGQIEKVRIGHDGANPGSGWFLDEVSIDVPSKGTHYMFAAHRWLDSKEEDGLIEIELQPTETRKGTVKIPYEITVWTGDVRGAGTDANVFIQMYGEGGKTEEKQIRNRTDNFEQGQKDVFKIEAEDVGPLLKIRVGHDGTKPFAGWFLDKLCIMRHPSKTSKRRACRSSTIKTIGRSQVEEDSEDGRRSPRGRQRPSSARRPASNYGEDEDHRRRRPASAKGRAGSVYGDDGDDYGRHRRSAKPRSLYGEDEDDVTPRRGPGSVKARSLYGHDDDDVYSRRRPSSASRRSVYGDDEEDVTMRRRPGSVKGRAASVYDEDLDKENYRRKKTRGSVYGDDDLESRRGRPGSARPRSFPRGTSSRASESDEEMTPRSGSRASSARRRSMLRRQDDVSDDESPWRRNKRRTLESDEEEEDRTTKNRKKFLRDMDEERPSRKRKERESRAQEPEEDIEEYWFVCKRWFAKGEDDGKIVRELLPTDEQGNPLDVGLKELEYTVKVTTGDVFGAGTDANVFINISGEFGDTGERALDKSNNFNKFERNQEDVFTVKAVELGRLKKVKISHDNKGGGGAWFLGHVEIVDPKTNATYFFPCQRWLAKDEDDGQISRELVPVDPSLKAKLSRKDSMAIRNEVALETKAAMTTYHVYVHTGDKFGAGTDANVYCQLYGENDDTGQVFLKSSKTNRDKFERNQVDEFVIEAVDIGDLKKIKVGHDNAGGGGAWYLERVEIDCPSLGKKWFFQCGKWLATGEGDGLLERELFPQDMATEEYVPWRTESGPDCSSPLFFSSSSDFSSNQLPVILEGVPYEITTYTSDKGGASTSANVYIVLYGRDTATSQKALCSTKQERKAAFKKGAMDKFVVELEDVGETIEKIRIGHDDAGIGSGWHLDKVEVRRLKDTGRAGLIDETTELNIDGSETYTFPCGRWLARDEDDHAVERELVAGKVVEETTRKDGTVKKRELNRRDTLQNKKYKVSVITGDLSRCGTDANVFLTMFGDRGDSGERKLHTSETNRDKFERGQTDIFSLEAVDLGKLFKVKIRHDNSMLSPAWFLDRVEIQDISDGETYTFHCERWLAKNKDDCKIDRTLYVKGYEGPMNSTSTLRSTMIGSTASFDSLKSTDPFSKSPRTTRKQLEEIPDGPTIPYTVKIHTGLGKDNGTESQAWIKISGKGGKKHTGKQWLEQVSKKGFEAGSLETFSLEAPDVVDVKTIEVGHDGVTPGTGWYIKEVEVDMPTKGKHYFFSCNSWLDRNKGDGRTHRTFSLQEGEASMVSYRPMVSYEMTIYTGDVQNAGTDAMLFLKVFGAKGASSDIRLDKASDRFERGRADLIKMELEDIAPLKKLRIGMVDGKGTRPEWYLEKVEMRNMDTGDLTVFNAGAWFSKTHGDKQTVRDLVAIIKGKKQLKTTSYKITVKTSDCRGAGTDANVYCTLFGETGDTGELHLKDSETNKSPFENNQDDVFTYSHLLSLGQLIKCRVRHDNKGFGAAWHLAHIEVEDSSSGVKYMFPCNRWLSTSEDDKQICRELTCANLPSPGVRDKVTYEITVTTTDKKDAGMHHNGWLILEGEERASKEFVLENSAKAKVLRKGQTDSFTMVSRNLGRLTSCILGAVEREDKPSVRDQEGRAAMWHCYEVTVTDTSTGDKYIFPCKDWINIKSKMSKKHAVELRVKSVEESQMTTIKSLGTVKYEVVVVTGEERSAGTDANVFLTIYGTFGDSGQRPLTQKFRDLFERAQTDKFQLEAVDLGDLQKIRIEHDDKGWGSGWLLDRVEITNMANSRKWTFPCGQWLDKKKGDGQISRELFSRD